MKPKVKTYIRGVLETAWTGFLMSTIFPTPLKKKSLSFRGVGEIVDIKKPVHAVSRTPRIEVLTFGFTNSAVSFYSLK